MRNPFVDETGHEWLRDKHPIYGLGGCGVLARDLIANIEDPWRRVRRAVSVSEEQALHAAALQSPNPVQIAAIAGT